MHIFQVFPSGVIVKWNMYKSFVALKNYQDAFDIVGGYIATSSWNFRAIPFRHYFLFLLQLSSIPVNQRCVRIVMALARLYLYYKSDAYVFILCDQCVTACALQHGVM